MKFIEISSSLHSNLKINRCDLILEFLLAISQMFCPKVSPEEHLNFGEYVSTVEPLFEQYPKSDIKDPPCYVDATLQEAPYDAVVIHLGVNDI